MSVNKYVSGKEVGKPRSSAPTYAERNKQASEFWALPDVQRAAQMRAVTWAATAKSDAGAARRRQDLANARKITNRKRAKRADEAVRGKFRKWQKDAQSQLIGRDVRERLRLYFKTQRPPIRQRKRLLALLNAGNL